MKTLITIALLIAFTIVNTFSQTPTRVWHEISESGRHDRDASIPTHRSFLVLSEQSSSDFGSQTSK